MDILVPKLHLGTELSAKLCYVDEINDLVRERYESLVSQTKLGL